MPARLIVHGGAWDIPADREADHLRAVRGAVAAVFPRLQQGLSALDAVEAAVRILEADPALNAGRGAVLNVNGEIELDAMIMDGLGLRCGGVAAVRNILHPVTLARAVMERTPHCLLAGEGALQFARAIGMSEVDPGELLTSRELIYYQEHVRGNPRFDVRPMFGGLPSDTVGAVAMDQVGNFAAATSTGGTAGKLPGRVGDSPIAGAGAYADNELGAASATGHGEAILRVVLTKTACDLLRDHAAQEAVMGALQALRRVQGLGGLILIDRQGNYGWGHSTTKMAAAWSEADGSTVEGIQ